MDKKERLRKAVDYVKFTKELRLDRDFAQMLGVDNATLSSALNGRTRVLTDSFLHKVAAIFPEISLQWLLTGEGDMLKSPPANTTSQTGNNNITQSGNNSGNASIADPSAMGRAMDEISRLTSALTENLDRKDGQIREKDGQINALIGIIQKMNEKTER